MNLSETEERQVKVKLPKLLWQLLDATEAGTSMTIDEWITSVVCKRILHLMEEAEIVRAMRQKQKETTQ